MPVSTCAAPIYKEVKTKFGYQSVIAAIGLAASLTHMRSC